MRPLFSLIVATLMMWIAAHFYAVLRDVSATIVKAPMFTATCPPECAK